MKPIKVYFLLREEVQNYQEDILILAHGLKELGIEFSGSANYWRENPEGEYLIKKTEIGELSRSDIVVVSYTYPRWMMPNTYEISVRDYPPSLLSERRGFYSVYMDHDDGYKTISWDDKYRSFDLILRAKFNRRAWHPENMKPWVLGLTNRMLRMTENRFKFEDRRRAIIDNFGASHGFDHKARSIGRKKFLIPAASSIKIDRETNDLSTEPADQYDRLMWHQTGYRHSRSYFDKLCSTQFIAAFCGDLAPGFPYHGLEKLLAHGNRGRVTRLLYGVLSSLMRYPARSVQWDSFRFWEALSAGCIPIHFDLQKYGVDLPVMPENHVHYIGIDLDRVGESIDFVTSDSDELGRISENGRNWVVQNYAPIEQAKRFLSYFECDGKVM